MRVLIALVVVLLVASAEPKNLQRIVGGGDADEGAYPQVASILTDEVTAAHTLACVGTILSARSILTAAVCTFGRSTNIFRIRVGSVELDAFGAEHFASFFINHPQYNAITRINDISIIRTVYVIVYGDNTRPAGLPPAANYNIGDGQHVSVVGWGSPNAKQQHVELRTVNQAICTTRYRELGRTINANMLCAGILDFNSNGPCQYDEGAPLFHNSMLVGVYSFRNGCVLSRYPSVYTRTSRYLTWLRNNI